MTLDDFISHENWPAGSVGFRLRRGRVVWTSARYTEGNMTGLAEVSRIVHEGGQAFTRSSSADPSTPIEFVYQEPAAETPCHDCGRADTPMPPRIRPPHLVPLCEGCFEHRHERRSPEELASLYAAERAAIDRRLTALDEERRRLRARLQFLAPPTPRERDALRRMVGGDEETEDDRRLLRHRGWSYPMTTDTGDVLSGLGRAVAAAHGVEPGRAALDEDQP